MKVLMRYGRNVLTFLSRTFKNHSKQPSEKNELDPISRLDSTCLFLSKILRLQQPSEKNELDPTFSLKRINELIENSYPHAEIIFSKTDSVHEININNSILYIK